MTTHPEELYDEILEDGPSPTTIFHLLSRMKQEGKLEWVIERCRRALDIHPNDIAIRKLLAEACFESGMIEEAEEQLEKISQLIDSFASVYRMRAEVLSRQGRKQEAIKALKLYLDHHPEDAQALEMLQSLSSKEEEKEAREVGPTEAFEEEAEEGELPGIATPTLAEVYVNQGKIEDAIQVYEKVLEREPEDQFSRHRLEELRAMLEGESPGGRRSPELGITGRETLIAILESWLAGIRKMARARPEG